MTSPLPSQSRTVLFTVVTVLGVVGASGRAADQPETSQVSAAVARAALVRLDARLEFNVDGNVEAVSMEGFKRADLTGMPARQLYVRASLT